MRSTPRSMMPSRIRRRAIICVLTSAALIFTACGDDDDTASGDSGAPSSDAPADDTAAPAETAAPTRRRRPTARRPPGHRSPGRHRRGSNGRADQGDDRGARQQSARRRTRTSRGGRGLRPVHQRQGRHRGPPARGRSSATTRPTPTRPPTAPARRSRRRWSPSSARSRSTPAAASRSSRRPRSPGSARAARWWPRRTRARSRSPWASLPASRRRGQQDGRGRVQGVVRWSRRPAGRRRVRRASPTATRSTGSDPSGLKYVKIPLVPDDYSAQAAQAIGEADCIFGNISEFNWPPLITGLAALGHASGCTARRATSTP